MPVQYGGGLRSLASVGSAINAGADRVVLGTAAFQDRAFLEQALGTWGTRVVVAIDVRGGRVSVSGWTEATGRLPAEVIRELEATGVEALRVHERGPRRHARGPGPRRGAPDLAPCGRRFLYSGGIGSLDDLRDAARPGPRLTGVISGKALYEGRFGVREARDVLAVTI